MAVTLSLKRNRWYIYSIALPKDIVIKYYINMSEVTSCLINKTLKWRRLIEKVKLRHSAFKPTKWRASCSFMYIIRIIGSLD